MSTEHTNPQTLKEHWQAMTLRNKEQLRYAVTLTMQQKHYCTESELGHWEKLTQEKASRELRHFKNLLNSKVYGSNWHKRLQGRKPNGLYFIPVIQGKVESGQGSFWNKREEAKTQSFFSDADGEVHYASTGTTSRRRFQNLHIHCFVDRDLSCVWDKDIKEMVEAKDLSEMTQMVRDLWNEVTYGAQIKNIDVQDIWSHPLKHEGWATYITSEMFNECEGYDHNSLVIP